MLGHWLSPGETVRTFWRSRQPANPGKKEEERERIKGHLWFPSHTSNENWEEGGDEGTQGRREGWATASLMCFTQPKPDRRVLRHHSRDQLTEITLMHTDPVNQRRLAPLFRLHLINTFPLTAVSMGTTLMALVVISIDAMLASIHPAGVSPSTTPSTWSVTDWSQTFPRGRRQKK